MAPTPPNGPQDAWEHGDAYERFIGRWSAPVADAFVAWLAQPVGLRWLDVGCGAGALAAAVARAARPAALVAVEPSAGFRAVAARNLGAFATIEDGNATAIPLPDRSIDVLVSGLVLNFVAAPERALAEFRRVVRPGGTIAAYVWDYADGMRLLRLFWDAARELDPAAVALDEGERFPLCRPDALRACFADTGLAGVATRAIDVPTRFRDFDDLWSPFLGGQGPAPTYVAGLAPAARDELARRLRARLPVAADGAIALTARAWAVRGTTPE